VPIAVAHRGDPLNERENTLAAFLAAVRAGADMVELDLRRTRDGHIVVLHDATLSRLWALERPVAELDLAEVVEVGDGELRIPTLVQVLETVEIPLMVDFTNGDVVDGALRAARTARAMERCLFVTGNVEALHTLRGLAPEARIGVTWSQPGPPPLGILGELGAEYWNPTWRLVTPHRVELAHSAGVSVSTWTVDDPLAIRGVIDAGVDAVVSNAIRTLRSQLGSP
jgi:glycerophosphoryl diester phosphodiesterase